MTVGSERDNLPQVPPRLQEGTVWRAALELVHEARALNHGLERLFRAGKIPFFLGSNGHEIAQIAAALSLRPGADWFFPYYRDSAFVLGLGQTTRQQLLSAMTREDDPSSGGRQSPAHWGLRECNLITQSSCAGSQFLGAVGCAEVVAVNAPGAIVYVSTGEGATSQGEFYEAVNWAALRRLPVLFFVQDNGYAITTPVAAQTAGGSISANFRSFSGLLTSEVDGWDFSSTLAAFAVATNHVRAGQGPALVHGHMPRLVSHSSADDFRHYRDAESLRADAARDPVLLFERWLVESGLISEAQLEASRALAAARFAKSVEEAARSASPSPDSVSFHVYGQDHRAAEVATAEVQGAGATGTRFIEAITLALSEELARDPRVFLFGEDVASPQGGVFGATRGLVARYGPQRVFNTPLAEASIVGVAMGMALAGARPVVEIQFADYIFPAMAQLRNEVAMLRYRSRGEWTCPMVIRAPCGGYVGGGHYHSQSIEGFFTHIPGLRVVYPSTAHDAKGLLQSAIRGDDPVLFLEHKALYRSAAAASDLSDGPVPLGVAALRRKGRDVTVVTYGALVAKALEAASRAAADGIECDVIDLRTLNPLDEATIFDSARKTRRVVVAYEGNRTGGFGAEIAARIAEACPLDQPLRRVAALDTPVPCAASLEEAMLPQVGDILAAILALAGRGGPGVRRP